MEEIVRLEGGGFGFLTRAQGRSAGLTVVLLNAGLIHRVGPQRLHVDLARELASVGYDVFRFDLPGVGDAAMEGVPQHAVVARVLDQLQSHAGNDRFVLGGICSAADLGWRVGVSDARVAGVLLIDPMAVQGHWYRIGRLRMALRCPVSSWPAKLLQRLRRSGTASSEDALSNEDYRDWPTAADFRKQAAQLMSRGTRVFAMYTGGVADYFVHPRQIDATFGPSRRSQGLRIAFEPGLDHIFFALADRRRVIGLLRDWLQTAFPVPRAA